MGIATQILKDLLRTAEGWLGVNDPLDLSYWSQILGKSIGTQKRFKCVKKKWL